MKKAGLAFLVFILGLFFRSQVQASVSNWYSCYYYNPNGGSELRRYCPAYCGDYPRDMVWPCNDSHPGYPYCNQYSCNNRPTPTPAKRPTPTPTRRHTPTPTPDPWHKPGRNTVYWQKTQPLVSDNGKELGAVTVQRIGNTLNVRYLVTKYRCQLAETRLSFADSENGLPRRLSSYSNYHRYNGMGTSDEYSKTVSSVAPDEKMFIAAYARVSAMMCNIMATTESTTPLPATTTGTPFPVAATSRTKPLPRIIRPSGTTGNRRQLSYDKSTGTASRNS